MCIDQKNWRFFAYRKHESPPSFRSKATAEIDRLTLNSISRYYPQFRPEDLERLVVASGVYVQSPKPHKMLKIHEFDEVIGACDGEPSKWLKVEVTSGEFHGRPITHAQYERFLSRQVPCCG